MITVAGFAAKVRADQDVSHGTSRTDLLKSTRSGWLSLLMKSDNTKEHSGIVYAWGGAFGRKPVQLHALGDDITQIAIGKNGAGVTLNKLGHVELFSYAEGINSEPKIVSPPLHTRAVDIALISDVGEAVIVDESGKMYTTTLLSTLQAPNELQNSTQVTGSAGKSPSSQNNSTRGPSLNRVILHGVNGRQIHRLIRSVKCGSQHCVALTSCGRVFSWGEDNSHGQLGNGDEGQGDPNATKSKTIENQLQGTSGPRVAREMPGPLEMGAVVDVACGKNHTLVVDENGGVFGCGSDAWTQLAASAHPWKPDHPKTQRGLTTASLLHPLAASSVAAGSNHSAFLMRDGNLFTSGFNQFGQLAHHNYSSFAPPSPIADFSLRVKQVAAGGDVTCVISENQKVLCIGANNRGQLGTGSQQPSAAWRKPNFGKKARIQPFYIYVGDESAAAIVTKTCTMNTKSSTTPDL